MTTRQYVRFWVRIVVATVSAALVLALALRPDWIELVFGLDPDQGSGAIERAIAAIPLCIALLSGTLAIRDWRAAAARAC